MTNAPKPVTDQEAAVWRAKSRLHLEAACTDPSAVVPVWAHERILRLLDERDRLREALRKLEWLGKLGDEEGHCPVCCRGSDAGHDPDCWLAALLGEAP